MLICPQCQTRYARGAECAVCSVSLIATGDVYVGQRIGGFVLTHLVGSNSRASVYRARGEHGSAAVKIYEPGPHALAPERVERERYAQRAVDHPYAAKLLDWGALDGGQTYLITRWVEGENLEAVLERGAFPWRRALTLAGDLATGAAAIHAAGVVHRDIKPTNVVLPESGNPPVTILDFGHSFVTSVQRLTESGVALGSVHYMAPEQAAGARVDARADLYSIGVILYRALTGTLPFDHPSSAELLRQHQQEPVVPPSARTSRTFPPAIDDLCLWLLAKSPDARVPNVRVLRITLNAISPARSRAPTEEIVA